MTYGISPQQKTPDYWAVLCQEIAAYVPEIDTTQIPSRDVDKWVLSSNLQKSIRRGLGNTAIGTATKLLALDPRYFWRRLLVIAYEDVGVANIGLCYDLLKFFRREAVHAQLGVDRVAAYFVEALSRSCKSRSLCDAIAMLEFNVRREEYEKPWFGMPDAEIVRAISCTEISAMRRVAALRHICGYAEHTRGIHRSITPARKELMREVCCRLELTEMETTLFISGQGVTDSLNIPIPLVVQLARGERREMQTEHISRCEDGILYAALDRHTRIGKRCLVEFAATSKHIVEFFRRHSQLNPVAVLGSMLFIIEGASLSRWLLFRHSDSLRQSFDRVFIQAAGVDKELVPGLQTAVHEGLSELNDIRVKALGHRQKER